MERQTNLDRLFTVTEVAKYLRLSKSQVYLMIAQRKLPYIRLSERRIAIKETDLKKWVEANCIKIAMPDGRNATFHVFKT